MLAKGGISVLQTSILLHKVYIEAKQKGVT